jgi:hypothetical protein
VQSQAFVTFLGWFDDDQHVYIAMEYFQFGTLDLYITQALKENDARTIALQLLEGVKIMHDEQFTHRDLKPQVCQSHLVLYIITLLIQAEYLCRAAYTTLVGQDWGLWYLKTYRHKFHSIAHEGWHWSIPCS